MKEHRRRNLILILASLLWAQGCGLGDRAAPSGGDVSFGGAPQTSHRDYSWPGEQTEIAVLNDHVDNGDRLVVQPTHALIPAVFTTTSSDRMAAFERAHASARSLIQAVAEQSACTAQVVGVRTARQSDREQWVSGGEVRMSVVFQTGDSPFERQRRVEDCLAAAEHWGGAQEELALRIGEPVITVNNAASYREQLLAHRMATLNQVVAAGEEMPQLRTRRCYSQGNVSIIGRSVEGVVLTLDMQCVTGEEEVAAGSPAL